jgi:putative oxidoreductase
MKNLKWFFQTSDETSLLIMRVALGIVMLPHGMQKALGAFGGYGFSGTVNFFVSQGIPAPIAALVIAGEFLGAMGLIVGLGTRLAALGIAIIMTTAALTVHLPNGFFMNWFGNQKGEGIEYFILAVGLAVALVIKGAGKFSLDRVLAKLQ